MSWEDIIKEEDYDSPERGRFAGTTNQYRTKFIDKYIKRNLADGVVKDAKLTIREIDGDIQTLESNPEKFTTDVFKEKMLYYKKRLEDFIRYIEERSE